MHAAWLLWRLGELAAQLRPRVVAAYQAHGYPLTAYGIDVPPALQKRIAVPYTDKSGNLIPPNGHYDRNHVWIVGPGHYENGVWIPGAGTYDQSGVWVADHSGIGGEKPWALAKHAHSELAKIADTRASF